MDKGRGTRGIGKGNWFGPLAVCLTGARPTGTRDRRRAVSRSRFNHSPHSAGLPVGQLFSLEYLTSAHLRGKLAICEEVTHAHAAA